MAQRAGLPAGLYIPQNSKIFNRDFNPLQIGLVVSPGVPWNLDQVHKAPHSSTIYPDRNNIAPRFGFAWQPRGFEKLVVRGGYGIYFERPSGSFKTDLQLSAPFFIYQNVPAPLDFADPYPRLNVNPFQVPLNVTIFRNEAGAPSWRRFDGSPFPATEPFSAKNYTFVDPFIRTPYVQQWTLNLQFEPAKGNLFDVRYVGTRGVKLMAKVNLAQALDPRESPINGFNSIRTSTGALINPDFFVPSEFLGLGRANGFRLRSNWAASTYHGLQVTYRRRVARSLMGNFGYTWAKTIDNISSDGGVVEHDARRIANNRGPADFDRTHRFTAAYVYDLPAVFGGANVLLRRLLHGWALNGLITLQSGSPFSVTGAATANAYWAQVGRVRVDFAPGKGIQDARKSGPVQDRMSNFFDPTVFANSEDRWGNTGRNILRGPVQRQFDFAVARSLPIKEQRSIEFRWEIFNAFNQATFSNPVSALPAAGTGTAGLISSTIGGPRTMQIALRLRF